MSATRTSGSCNEPGPGADCITLLPGVACHLRERAPLIRRLAQTEWLRFVLSLKQNQPVLGRAVGLSEFLFGSSRAALSLKVSSPLAGTAGRRRFYRQRSLPSAAAVDHFIPWSRYPRDLAHNLVLADGTCNSRKSDLLGGEAYLERWVDFVSDHDSDLLQLGTEAGSPGSSGHFHRSGRVEPTGMLSAFRPRCGSAGRNTGTCRAGGGNG